MPTRETQPTPTVTRADVERVVRRDFAPAVVRGVLDLLDSYNDREQARVQLAALKLANGDVARLGHYVEAAKCDWRDVLGAAEYPKYTKKAFRIDALFFEERRSIIDADWQQYQEWINATSRPTRRCS